jgi:threonine dehydratase
MTDVARLSAGRIAEAYRVIDPVFRDSPQLEFPALSARLGASTLLKVETLNPIRSFKGRGCSYLVHGMRGATPLVCASAGNFGQGLAFAARSRGIGLTVFAAEGANPLKVERMRGFGATVVLSGKDFDAAKAAARAHAAERGWAFVEDGHEPAIAEGAGTIALELLRAPGRLDAVVVPLGNGSLLNGVGTWIRAHAPETRVVGVVARGAPAMERSWRSGTVVTTPTVETIADGIAVRVPVPRALADMRGVVDDVLEVSDPAMLGAMRLLLMEAGLLTEPAGAAGLAAVLEHAPLFAGRRIATILCGSNVSQEQFAAWFAAAT